MTGEVIYFAFGSNLHAPQMQSRCPGCAVLQPALLPDYRLAFCGRSEHWAGGVATIVPAPGRQVPGLLYRLTPGDLERLNGYEAYPTVYDQLPVQVTGRDGRRLAALTYRKRTADPQPPSLRYFHQMWRAYRTHRLDETALLAAVEEALGGPADGDAPWRPGLR